MRKLLLLILILALPSLCYAQYVSQVNSSVIADWGYALNSEIHDSLDAKTSAVWLTRVSDETGTGVWVFGTSPTFTTDITSPLIIGGTATTSDLSLKTTSGVGESGADMHFLVGNNGATEAMTVLNSGNVGVGINSPSSILHIKANTSGTVGSHPAGQLIIQNPTNSVVSNAVITGYESDDAGNPDQQLWYLGNSSGSNSDVLLLNRRASSLHLGTNDAIRLTIDEDGKVGIGTLSPPERLSIVGNIAIGDTAEADVDVYHYFSTDGSWTAKYLKYDDGLGEFQFNDDLTVTGDAYHVTSTETDSQFMSKKYIDDAAGGLVAQSVKGDHVDSTSEDFVFDNAYKGTSADAVKADSILVTAQTVRLAIEDSLDGYLLLAGGTMTGDITMSDNGWIGLGSGSGKIEFDNQTIDEINFLNCYVGIGTSTPKRQFDFDGGNVRTQRYIDSDLNTNLGDATFGAGNLTAEGTYNSAFGRQALYGHTSGTGNTAIGADALYTNTTGSNNVGMGYCPLKVNTEGNHNIAIGYKALYVNTTGNNNISIGSYSTYTTTTGSDNIVIGYDVDAPNATASSKLNIGNVIYGDLISGNIGIGDATPAALLTVGDGDDFQVSSTGEISTSSNLIVAGRITSGDTLTASFVIASPDDTYDFPFWQTKRAITIVAVSAVCTGGTNVIGALQEYNATGTSVDAAVDGDWTITTSEYTDASFTNAGIDAGDWLGWKTTSVSGSVTFFSITFEYTEQ